MASFNMRFSPHSPAGDTQQTVWLIDNSGYVEGEVGLVISGINVFSLSF